MKIRIYDMSWEDIDEINWPDPGQIFIAKDPQNRLGPDTWGVARMKDHNEYDLTSLGLFWEKDDALIFAKAIAG